MSGTTAKGIVYPTNTDNIDFAGDMQALAESVNNNFLRLTGDTFTGPVTANEGLGKGYRLYNSTASAGARGWSIYLDGGEFRVGKTDDTYGTSIDALKIDRATTRATFDGPVAYRNYAFRMYRPTGGGTFSMTVSANTWSDCANSTHPMTKEYGEDSTLDLNTCSFTAPVSGYYSFFARTCQTGVTTTTHPEGNSNYVSKFILMVNGVGVQEVQTMTRNFGDRRRMELAVPAVYVVAGEVVKPQRMSPIANQAHSKEWEVVADELRGILLSAA